MWIFSMKPCHVESLMIRRYGPLPQTTSWWYTGSINHSQYMDWNDELIQPWSSTHQHPQTAGTLPQVFTDTRCSHVSPQTNQERWTVDGSHHTENNNNSPAVIVNNTITGYITACSTAGLSHPWPNAQTGAHKPHEATLCKHRWNHFQRPTWQHLNLAISEGTSMLSELLDL